MTTITGMLALILQLGITMLVPIVFCTIGGAWLGERVGWLGFPVIGFFLGAAGGMQGAWKLIRRMTADWPESEVSQQALDRAQRSKAGTETAAETQHSKTGTETAAETQHSKAGTETAAETQHSKTGTETAAETQHSKAGTETAAETTEGDSR